MGDPVAKRTAIWTIAARDRAWNADELGPHFIAGEPHRRIAVTAHIHEFKVRGKLRIGNGVSARFRSKLLAYSRQERTPCLRSML